MGKRINTDELEDYLKEVADGHRMYPSNQIWTNIRENLHGTTRWPALTFISLFIITSLVIGTIFIKPDETIMKQIASESSLASRKELPKNNFAEQINPEKITSRTIDNALVNQLSAILPEEDNATVYQSVDKQIQTNDTKFATPDISTVLADITAELVLRNQVSSEIITSEVSAELTSVSDIENKKVENKEGSQLLYSNIVLPKKTKQSRWEVGFYITPSSSFRTIKDDNTIKGVVSAYNVIPASSNNMTDVNQVIRHKPAMGVEAGVAFGYKLNRHLKLKAGLQVNIRQYDIDAYRSSTEWVQLTVNTGRRIDTLNTLSNFRNGNGTAEVTLKNKYHEIAAPVGLEWTGDITRKLSWGFAATVQPTYTFGKKAYLISNDYKNYTADGTLFRNWNLNTGVEAFLNFKAGDFTWHLGPQVRYQQLSSYSKLYPIKENLYDYGVKFGFTKTIR